MGCCRLNFLHALDNDQGLLAHTPTKTGVPPPPKKKIKKWTFRNWHKIQRISRNNFGFKGSNLTKLFHVLGTPNTWKSAKTVQNSARLWITFDFYREYLRNGSRYRQAENNRNSKIGLKFTVLAVITLGPRGITIFGITSRNFST